MAKEDKEQFFVGIHETRNIRRNILEGSREMVHILQSYDKVTNIRDEKLKRINQLRTVLEELKLLVSKLNQAMPKVQVREPSPKILKTVKVEKGKKTTKKNDEAQELKMLEQELASIEGKLSQIK